MIRRDVVWLFAVVGCIAAVGLTGCDRTKDSQKKAVAESAREAQPGSAMRSADKSLLGSPPKLVNLDFKPSKFLKCGQEVEICAEAKDPDGDKLTFDWEHVVGEEPLRWLKVTETRRTEKGTTIQCIDLKPDEGMSQFRVTIGQESKDGKVAGTGDSLTFPLHVQKSKSCS